MRIMYHKKLFVDDFVCSVVKEKEKLSWLEPCDGANIRTCLQSLSTDT